MRNQNRSVEEIAASVVTPLESFYKFEKDSPDSACYVQPYPDGSLVTYSWREAGEQIRAMAAYIKSLELQQGSNIALMSANCAYWIMADIAIWMAGHCSVPLYPVLGPSTIQKILEHSESEVMFVGKLQGWDEMSKGVPAKTQIITFPLSPPSAQANSAKWSDIIAKTKPLTESPSYPKSNLATIIYTSGTTGMPKGVMHSFATMGLVATLAGQVYDLSSVDRKISYLPLAHVAERAAIEISQLYYGYTLYFSNSIDTFAEDLRRARPTSFFAVPRIWTKFQQRVLEHIDDEALQAMLADPVKAPAIQKKLLSALGLDNLRIGVSGAAPLSTSLIDWFKRLGIEILEGYGMSENFAFSHTTKSGLAKTGYVGTPSPFVECKLSEEGEILVKSPGNMIGYFKEPQLTAQAINEEGFLHTGDRGEIDADNRLRITGRTKELFKTNKGKYVAPAPIENKVLQNLAVESVCVTGANLTQPLALINLNPQALENMSQDALSDSLLVTLDSLNRSLDKHENLSHIVITDSQWSVDNGLMTPTMKIKRAELEKLYNDKLAVWQASTNRIIFEKTIA